MTLLWIDTELFINLGRTKGENKNLGARWLRFGTWASLKLEIQFLEGFNLMVIQQQEYHIGKCSFDRIIGWRETEQVFNEPPNTQYGLFNTSDAKSMSVVFKVVKFG